MAPEPAEAAAPATAEAAAPFAAALAAAWRLSNFRGLSLLVGSHLLCFSLMIDLDYIHLFCL